MTEQELDFTIDTLGECKLPNPLKYADSTGLKHSNYVEDDQYIIWDVYAHKGRESLPQGKGTMMEKAGPRPKIYFNPNHVHAAIVTCGGLCPGLNDVIRSLVRNLWYGYGVRRITGIQYGFKGFLPEYNFPVIELNPDIVDDIHKIGGTMLGSSRGGNDTPAVVDAIERMNLNILFTIGGDGTQRGALAVAEEIERRNLKVTVVGIPKTIDNDLSFIQRSFGFETAVSKAVQVVTGAHVEADSAIHGIGLVKVMGRDSGFIASHTALASTEVNFVLIPEVDFDLGGPSGFLEALKKRLQARKHAVIVVAEGAGQKYLARSEEKDASGNRRLGDIGVFLRDKISEFFRTQKMEINLRYIDPSYIIRSAPAEPNDSLYCARLGANAVHAAMTGRTKMLVSLWSNKFVHVPIKMATYNRNYVNPEGSLWRDVIEATRQPVTMLSELGK
jgi:6-phosphofructokinase 1